MRYFVIDLETARAHGVDIDRAGLVEDGKLYVPLKGLRRFAGTTARQEARKQSTASALKAKRRADRDAARKAADDKRKADRANNR